VKFPSSGGAGSFTYSWLVSMMDFGLQDSQAFFFGLSPDAGQENDQTFFSHSFFINETTTTGSTSASPSTIMLPAPTQAHEPMSVQTSDNGSGTSSRAVTGVGAGVGFGLGIPLVLLAAYNFFTEKIPESKDLSEAVVFSCEVARQEGAWTGDTRAVELLRTQRGTF
jgi:hypothetical protein